MSENALPAGLVSELAAFVDARIAEALRGLQKAVPTPVRLLTLQEAAARLGRSPSWLYHHHRRLRLSRRHGGRLVFLEDVLERYLRALERG
jgi:hypothetical protein